ncbi:MAG: hypothetical protein AAFU85_17850 [Planctomycetota bacterium]
MNPYAPPDPALKPAPKSPMFSDQDREAIWAIAAYVAFFVGGLWWLGG